MLRGCPAGCFRATTDGPSADFNADGQTSHLLPLPDLPRDHGQLHSMDVVSGETLSATSGHAPLFQNDDPFHQSIDPARAAPAAPAAPAAVPTRADMEVAPASNDAPNALAPAPAMEELPPVGPPAFNKELSNEEPMALMAAYGLQEEPFAVQTTCLNDFALQQQQRLSAFARLRFNDGSYYMHTYQIILGRDVELARRDMKRLQKAERLKKAGDIEGAEAIIKGKKRRRGDHRPRSVISQAGGIVSASMSDMPMEYQQLKQSETTQSRSSSSHHTGESIKAEPIDLAPQEVIMRAFAEVPDRLESYVPEDPNDCPLVPIHPQHIFDMSGTSGPKGISRQHAKISYNFQTGGFEIEVLSGNGLWHEEEFYQAGAVIPLDHGDSIIIGKVDIMFLLPDITLTDEQRAKDQDSRPMSFSFENGRGELESDDLVAEDSASEEASVDPRHVFHVPVIDYDEDEEALDSDDEMEDPPSSPEPRRKKKKVVKQKEKQRHVIKLKLKNQGKSQMPPPKKEIKTAPKRRHSLLRDTSPDEPIAKRPKPDLKDHKKHRDHHRAPKEPKEGKESKEKREPGKETQKEKGKAPLKAPPAKPQPVKTTPAKEATPVVGESKPEPVKTPVKSESPTLARRPAVAGNLSGDEGEQEGTITAEMIKQHGLPESLLGMVMEKRKGPGRPPKDGVMSKRQRAQLVKQGKEIDKARAAGIDPADLPLPLAKPKIARPRKDSNACEGEGGEDDIRESTEKGDGTATGGDKKQNKLNKPPRTPSPEMRIEDYTEEQLQRPAANYVVLIHEAISSSPTGQMNLQQIYNYIERTYPWYKFKTTTSGWQSSVRHNLGQHDAFVKGDKEGKGFNWRINPEVSIEKERRKRQASPQLGHAQRQGYYPPPNGYPPYAHPGGPYNYGMPGQGPPNGAPQPAPPNVETVQPRLPPSLARSAAPAAQGAPNPSPYASPWAGGNTANNPPNQNPPRFPPSSSQTPPVTSAAATGQYGVLFPTSAPQAPYNGYPPSGPYGSQPTTVGASPYGNGTNRAYTPYAPAGTPANGAPSSQPPSQSLPPQTSNLNQAARPPHSDSRPPAPVISRYPAGTDPFLIHQLEAFREHYIVQTPLPRLAEETKVDNVIRALVNHTGPGTLTDQEQSLYQIIDELIAKIKSAPQTDAGVEQEISVVAPSVPAKPTDDLKPTQEAPKTVEASTAAAIAASDAAVAASGIPNAAPMPSGVPNHPHAPSIPANPPANLPVSNVPPNAVPKAPSAEVEPHKFTPNMGGAPVANMGGPPTANMVSPPTANMTGPPTANMGGLPTVLSRVQTSRPSVEPLTPVPGSPAPVPNGAPFAPKVDVPGTTAPAGVGQGGVAAGVKDGAPVQRATPPDGAPPPQGTPPIQGAPPPHPPTTNGA